MKEKSVKLNAVLNVTRTLLALVFPLITYPYISHILLPVGMGKVTFSNSIVSYFALLAGLGVATYGVREGAKVREQKEKIERFCSDVFSINVYATIVAYILLFAACAAVPKIQPYKLTILIFSLQIILTTMGVNWILNIYEEFTLMTILTIVTQILGLILMFVLVHTPEDLNKYALINVLAYSGSDAVLFFYARKFTTFRFVFKPDLSHLRRILVIFSTAVAATIYVNSDITILGWVAGDYYAGLYGTSANIYKIVKMMLSAIIAVVVPRFAFYLGNGQIEKLKKLSSDLINGMITLCLPAMVGLFCLSRPIIEVFAGEMYTEAAGSLRLLSIALGFAVFVNFFANCILLSYRKEMNVMIATVISAAVNLGLNLVLIPRFFDLGAAFTTILAEIVMCAISFIESRKVLQVEVNKKILLPVILGCIAIAAVCYLTLHMLQNKFLIVAVAVPVSIAVYGAIQILCKNTAMLGTIRRRQQ